MDSEGLRYIGHLSSTELIRKEVFKLDAIRQAMHVLGCPQDAVRTIHIAGTNGKGSVSATIASILGAAGHKVGLTTSPHLGAVNERIVVDGWPISDVALNSLALEVKLRLDSAGVQLTFFEFMTACAFVHFVQQRVDYAVIEVGLGGRLDATNVISSPEVSAIVSIDLDHQEILGADLVSIAREKAGIIKPGSPVVVGNVEDAPKKAIHQMAAAVGAPVIQFGRDFILEDVQGGRASVVFPAAKVAIPIKPKLLGAHQLSNAAVACAVAQRIGISHNKCSQGILNVRWPGRIEILCVDGQEVILDSAHNPAGIEVLTQYLRTSGRRDLHIVFGALSTKCWQEMIELLKPFAGEWTLLLPSNSKALPTTVLRDVLSGFKVSEAEFGSDYGAFVTWLKSAHLRRPVLVCGSMYMLGGVRSQLITGDGALWSRGSDEVRSAA